jgi:hypothetical protein
MKDQYVGHLNDFENHALLRVLGPAGALPLENRPGPVIA